MTFAIKGEGGLECQKGFFFFNFLFKSHLKITPWLPKRVLRIVLALYCVYSRRGDYEHGLNMTVGGRISLRMSILNQL